MTRSSIAEKVAIKIGKVNKNLVEEILLEFFKQLAEGVVENKKVELKGFGTFKLVELAPKRIKNIHSGEIEYTQKTYKIRFKAGKFFKDAIESKLGG